VYRQGQLDAAVAQETYVARRADERAHALPALEEQRDKVVSQETGRASDKDHVELWIFDFGVQ